MKIGEFAQACGVSISLLRYYDNTGVLKPVYIDKFTGYRYYAEDQISICAYIGELKLAGFSLKEIKQLIEQDNHEVSDKLFLEKQQELERMLRKLEETQKCYMKNKVYNKETWVVYKENIALPFENDENVVGRWSIIEGEGLTNEGKREFYFLPDGEFYWCFGWTKGFILCDDGVNTFANEYSLEQRQDGLYMSVKLKSYDYAETGKTEEITLKKMDGKRYTKSEISRKDNINLPFKKDENVLGKWIAYDFIEKKADFSAEVSRRDFKPYFKEIEFFPLGRCVSVYGDEIITENEQSWTKGYVLRKFNHTACSYEIRYAHGREFLIMEWKSGDYRFGGFDTDYYVFVRK